MRWPPWKPDHEERAKLAQAESQRDAVVAQWPNVRYQAAQALAHQQRNHFAQSIRYIFRGA